MLEQLKAALKETGLPFAHFGWSEAPAGDYGIYAEDGANDFESDGQHSELALTGTVDYFTRDDSGAPKATVEDALRSVWNCVWYMNSVQFEQDTGYIHYEWVFEVV